MGTTMVTRSGKVFDFANPKPEMICIEDIAHHLSIINRYNGATLVPYSVAEHCVRMAEADLPGDKLARLLHDAAEAYIGDIVRPFKRRLEFTYYVSEVSSLFNQAESVTRYEYKVQDVILAGLGIGKTVAYLNSAEIKEADNIMLATEVRDLIYDCPETRQEFGPYLEGVTPLRDSLHPMNVWHWVKAKTRFINLFMELTK